MGKHTAGRAPNPTGIPSIRPQLTNTVVAPFRQEPCVSTLQQHRENITGYKLALVDWLTLVIVVNWVRWWEEGTDSIKK